MRTRWITPLALLLAVMAVSRPLAAQSSYRDEAVAAYGRGEYPEAVALYEKSLAVALKVLKEGDVEITERRAELGQAYLAAGRWNEAITQLDYAWKRARFDAESQHHWNMREGAMAMGFAEKLGRACQAGTRYEDAIMVFKTALADAQRVGRVESAMQFAGLLADTQYVALHEEDAMASVRLAAELSTQLPDNPTMQARALGVLGALCLHQKHPEMAKPLVERALTLALQVYPADNLTVAEYQEMLAAALIATDSLDEAETHLKAARDSILQHENAESRRMVDVLLDQSALALKRNLPDDALTHAQEALAVAKKCYTDQHPETARCLSQVARCQLALNQPAKARPLFTQALAVFARTLGEDAPQTIDARMEATNLGPKLTPAESSAAPAPER